MTFPGRPRRAREAHRDRPGEAAGGPVLGLGAVLALAAAALYLAVDATGGHQPAGARMPFWLLALLFAVAERLAVHVSVGRETHTMSFAEAPLVLGLLFSTPSELVAGRLLGAGLVGLLLFRQPPLKLLFNLTSFAAQTTAAIAVYAVVGVRDPFGPPGWAALLVAATVAALVGGAAVSTVIRLTTGRAPHDLAREVVGWLVTALINVDLALTGALLVRGDGRAVVLLVVLVGVSFLLYRAYELERQRHGRLDQLYRFTRVTDQALQEGTVRQAVLGESAELMRATYADVIRVDGPEMSAAVDPGMLAQSWWRPALAGEVVLLPRPRHGPHPALAGTGHRDAIAAPMGHGHGTDAMGVLVVADRLDNVSTFDADDARLLEALAGHAGVSFANADLVERVRDEAAAREQLALHDRLTGLPNRTAFTDELDRRIATSGRAAVLLMDLDRFREVNDTLGHGVGDELVRQVAARLESLRRDGATVARLGGDEFAVLAAGEVELDGVLARIARTFATPFGIDGVDLDVGASTGIAVAPQDGTSAAVLLRRAEVAMYEAKEGVARVARYEPERDPYSQRRLSLASDLARALERRSLTLSYQPEVNPTSGQVAAMEALLRWQHPAWGAVPPDEFVPLAEQTGIIRPLSRFVVEEALRHCHAWNEAGTPVVLAVNISSRNLLEPDFADDVARLLVRTRVPAHLLKLEITEGAFMTDVERSERMLHRLVDLGLAVSVDDFGTGYSSLSRLHSLPVSEVKVDRTFVRSMATRPDDRAIVRSVVDLGHDLGLRVVAEGVEDEDSWALLTSMGCDLIQGYLVARPMSGDDATAWLREHYAARATPLERTDRTERNDATGPAGDAGRGQRPARGG